MTRSHLSEVGEKRIRLYSPNFEKILPRAANALTIDRELRAGHRLTRAVGAINTVLASPSFQQLTWGGQS
jgi:hypothetical protein